MGKISRTEWRKKYRKALKKRWEKDPRRKGPFSMSYDDLFKELQEETKFFFGEEEEKQEADRGSLLDRYQRIKKGENPDDFELESFTTHKTKGKLRTVFVPAPWGMVVALAILNSFAVFWTKVVVFETLGKPDIWKPSQEVVSQTSPSNAMSIRASYQAPSEMNFERENSSRAPMAATPTPRKKPSPESDAFQRLREQVEALRRER